MCVCDNVNKIACLRAKVRVVNTAVGQVIYKLQRDSLPLPPLNLLCLCRDILPTADIIYIEDCQAFLNSSGIIAQLDQQKLTSLRWNY